MPGVRRKAVPILATMTDKRRQLNKQHFKTNAELAKAAHMLHLEKKATNGEDSLYAQYQPYVVPKPKELIGKRIDINWKIDGELQWC